MYRDTGRYISCCKDCEERYIGCHSKCERYIQEIENWKKVKKQISKNKTYIVCNSDFGDYVGKRTKRYIAKRI